MRSFKKEQKLRFDIFQNCLLLQLTNEKDLRV